MEYGELTIHHPPCTLPPPQHAACVSDLSLYEEHSAILKRLCEALCYLQPAISMA